MMAMSLDQEDRQWIVDTLEANLERVRADINTEIGEKLEAIELRFTSKLEGMAANLLSWHEEQLTGLETRLTTVINRRVGSLDMQQRATSAQIAALRLDMDDLKDRMERLEGHGPQ